MWTQQFINTERGTFEVFVKGSGEPICITHLYSEFNTNGNYFANPFSEHFQVFLVNLRGAGNSAASSSEEDLSMEETCKDLEAVREALGHSQWAFAGHSSGGMLGLVYALRFPESLTKIVISGASASKEYMYHPESIYCRENPNNPRMREILQLMNNQDTPVEERRAVSNEWTMMSLYRPEKLDEYFLKPNSGKTVPKRLDYFAYKEVLTFDLTDRLHKISTHAYVFCGRHDAQCPHVFSEEIANEIPNARLITFEESNHFPYVEEEEKFRTAVAVI